MELIKIVNYTKLDAVSWDVTVVYKKDQTVNTLVIHTVLDDDQLTFSAPGYEAEQIEALTKDIGDFLTINGQVICETVGFDSHYIYCLPVTHHYRIFQLAHNDPKLFAKLTKAEDVDFGDYVCVWHDTFYREFTEKCLDQIFTKFNVAHPYNFGGHSLSISDIIEVYDEDENYNRTNFRYFYCDSIGWAELPVKDI